MWAFPDPPNTAVFTMQSILNRTQSICTVTHDLDDGSWQFHGSVNALCEDQARVVSLRTIVELDQTVQELANLPIGWQAKRIAATEPWVRSNMPV